jgi:hypothetical protein
LLKIIFGPFHSKTFTRVAFSCCFHSNILDYQKTDLTKSNFKNRSCKIIIQKRILQNQNFKKRILQIRIYKTLQNSNKNHSPKQEETNRPGHKQIRQISFGKCTPEINGPFRALLSIFDSVCDAAFLLVLMSV